MDIQTASLQDKWESYREAHPQARHRSAAQELGVTELELVDAECGMSAMRLQDDWGSLITSLTDIGPLMALTRNDVAVHEKTGVYTNIHIHDTHQMGQVLGDAIDLRLFLGRWSYGYAVDLEKDGSHVLRGLQFFDKHGTAVHKIYLRGASDESAFDALVEKFADPDPAPVQPAPATAPSSSSINEIDQEKLLSGWRKLKDTHDFFPLIRSVGCTRLQALHCAEGEFTHRVDTTSHRAVLSSSAEKRLPIMVFVRSPGTVQIHTGPVHRLKDSKGWYNVLDDGFNLHLNESRVAESWVVQKPTKDGLVTSLELYDDQGVATTQFFGDRKPGRSERGAWRELAMSLA